MKTNNISAGKQFEENVLNRLAENPCVCNTTNTKKDYFCGIDFYFLGIPVDITLDIEGKDNCTIFSDSAYLQKWGTTVRYGIRTGNKKSKFETPVLVIGITPSISLSSWGVNIVDEIANNIDKITEIGENLYWEWMDSNVETA